MPVRSYDAKLNGFEADFFDFPNKSYVAKDLIEAFKPFEKVTVTVKSRRKPRSLPQNAYLHMCINMIADETGNRPDVIKSTLKSMYAKKPLLDKDGEQIYDPKTGESVSYVQDTADMSTFEAFEFTEKVRMFAQDFCNLILPLPDENIALNFKEQ